jgi:hypothetical protein
MFDVLDSVESALSQGSATLSQGSSTTPKTASFGRSSSELSRLQQEITALELQVFGASTAAPSGNGTGTNFHDFMDLSSSQSAIAALNGTRMAADDAWHVVSTEAIARGKGKGRDTAYF